jgi:hypothetical protein
MSSRLPRRLAPWLVVLALAAPLPAAALPFGDAGAALFSKLRAALSSLWGDSNKANGCEFDPYGHCAPAQAPNGCQLDPDGACSAVVRDNACEFDPHGNCSAVVRDNGCQVDPNGLCEK